MRVFLRLRGAQIFVLQLCEYLRQDVFQLFRRTRLAESAEDLLARRIAVLVLIAWLPLLLLTLADGHAVGKAGVPFLFDLDSQFRLLLCIPLLLGAEVIIHRRLKFIVRQFLDLLVGGPLLQRLLQPLLRLAQRALSIGEAAVLDAQRHVPQLRGHAVADGARGRALQAPIGRAQAKVYLQIFDKLLRLQRQRLEGAGNAQPIARILRELAPLRYRESARALAGAFRVAYLLSGAVEGVLPRTAIRQKGNAVELVLSADLAELRGARIESRLRQFAALGGLSASVVVEK